MALDGSQSTTSTLPGPSKDERQADKPSLDLSALSPIYLMSANLTDDDLHSLEELLQKAGGTLTYNAKDAKLCIGNISQKKRAMFELRKAGVWTEEAGSGNRPDSPTKDDHSQEPPTKKQRTSPQQTIRVVSKTWLDASIAANTILNHQPYTIYTGALISRPDAPQPPRSTSPILHHPRTQPFAHQPFPPKPPLLLHSTTSHDSSPLPAPPDWILKKLKYACQRPTPPDPPNGTFIAQLLRIRLARELTLDQIGVRAYSTAIAALSAYPHTLSSASEVQRIPGCEAKIAALYEEYSTTGRLSAVDAFESDPEMAVLRLFHNIWGVGAHTARAFFAKGWRDLDDVVEFGWDTLSREQQIGVKFYDDFLLPIPRQEVEQIAGVVEEHCRKVLAADADGVRTCVVGGYRRGKAQSGDVDIVVSHVRDALTLGVVDELVRSLHRDGWITHSLKVYFTGTKREQGVKPLGSGGHGFDSLDKAFVVWRDPRHKGERNGNPHRRVDIIVAPWSRVGCAVAGWTSGMTFQRDLRRYANKVKGWKFDSSGVRDLVTGKEVDLQGPGCEDIVEAEKRVFEGLGLQWREPWERCTS